MPEGLWPPPEPPEGFGAWLQAFWTLNADRQIGMGLGPIPNAAIRALTDGMGELEAVFFTACIREMDAAFLKANREAE